MTLGFFFTTLGYVVGALVFWWQLRARNLATSGMTLIALAAWGGGIVGTKLTEWLTHSQIWKSDPALILNPHLGGRTILGGVLCGWLAVEIAKKQLGIARSTGDLFALALPAGEAVGRLGCFFNQCCYGVPTNVLWACNQHGDWRHPTQIYLAISAALVFLIVLRAQKHLSREGDLFKLYLTLFGLSRFAIEFWRERNVIFAGLSLAQLACLAIALIGALGFARSHKKYARIPAYFSGARR